MSRQLKSKFSIATLTAVVSLILSSQVAEAATIGKTNVISSQNQPLSASIDVSNIDANNFSADIAGKAIYQQMDMNTDVPVRVQFVKTSPSTGKLILTSSQPVTDPYADVVLVLNDNGKQQSLPKTLLLPINDVPAPSSPVVMPREPVTATSNVAHTNTTTPIEAAPKAKNNQYVMVGDSIKPSLPTVQARTPAQTDNTTNSRDDNITVTRTIKPVSNNQPSSHFPVSNAASTSSNTNVATGLNTPVISTQAQRHNNTAHAQVNNKAFNNNTASTPLALSDSNIQAEILTTEISRKIKLPNGELKVLPIAPDTMQANRHTNAPSTANSATATSEDSIASTPTNQYNFKPLIPAPAFKPSATGVQDNMIEDAIVRHTRETPYEKVINVNTPETVPKPYDTAQTLQAQSETVSDHASTTTAATSQAQEAAQANTTGIGLSKVTYTVQRNDNLWTIANQIARQNQVDVDTVMNQIQQYNPNAFINGDARMLKANAKLAIPDYEVIPSRLGIRAATNAQKASSRTPSRSTNNSNRRRRAAARPLPRANVRLVTPSNSGSAVGSGHGGLSSALTNKVQETRQHTANEARRVAGLNSQLSEYTHKLRFQNERLSDLEMRLKQLRQQ